MEKCKYLNNLQIITIHTERASFNDVLFILVGVWNDDPSDDFMKRDETFLTRSANGSYTDMDFFEFGQTCKNVIFQWSTPLNILLAVKTILKLIWIKIFDQ